MYKAQAVHFGLHMRKVITCLSSIVLVLLLTYTILCKLEDPQRKLFYTNTRKNERCLKMGNANRNLYILATIYVVEPRTSDKLITF